MRSSILSQVRQNKERVLVHLVWILGRIARLCCKCEFGNAIIKLFTRLTRLNCVLVLRSSAHLLWNRGSNILSSRCARTLFRARSQVGLYIDLGIGCLARGVNCVVDGVGGAALALIFPVSPLVFRWSRLRGWLGYEFAFDALVIIIIIRRMLLVQWHWLLVETGLVGAFISIRAFINCIVLLVNFGRWL